MTLTRFAVVGLVALAACAGCATGTRTTMGMNGGNGSASPATTVDAPQCSGWYDAAAGVCDSIGD